MSKQKNLIEASQNVTFDTDGNVGIGTSSPEGQLHLYGDSVGAPSADANDLVIEKTGDTGLSILSTTTGRIYFGDAASNDQGSIRYVHSDNSMRFETDSSEAMRIDANGRLLVGKTASSSSTVGGTLEAGSILGVSTGQPLRLNRKSSDGDIIQIWKDSASVGSIGAYSSRSFIGSGSVGLFFDNLSNTAIRPFSTSALGTIDNHIDLGSSSNRFDDIYATNGTIQTSDRNEKQDIEALSDAEQRVAVACKGLLRKFRWKDAVAEKGDDARIHFGIIAQDLQDAFAAEGLDAGRYAMFISSTWWETQTEVPAVEADEENGIEAKDAYTRTDTYETLEEAPEGATERTRLGVRYPELLAFIIGAM